jgi:hypothetical protein
LVTYSPFYWLDDNSTNNNIIANPLSSRKPGLPFRNQPLAVELAKRV